MKKIIFLFVLLFTIACGASPPPDDFPIQITEEQDKEKHKVKPKLIWKDPSSISSSTKPTFIFFTWKKCAPCKEMSKVFADKKLTKQLLLFNTVQIEESDSYFYEWATKYKVRVFPTFVVLASTKDKDYIDGFSGYIDAENLLFYLGNVYTVNKMLLIQEQANNILEIF